MATNLKYIFIAGLLLLTGIAHATPPGYHITLPPNTHITNTLRIWESITASSDSFRVEGASITKVGTVDGRKVSADGVVLDSLVISSDTFAVDIAINTSSITVNQTDIAINISSITALQSNKQDTLISGTTYNILVTTAIYARNASGTTGGATKTITQAAHGLSIGNILKYNGASYEGATSDSASNAEVIGIVSSTPTANTFTLLSSGFVENLTGLSTGYVYFLSSFTAGGYTLTPPNTADTISKPVLIPVVSTAAFFYNFRGITILSTTSVNVDNFTNQTIGGVKTFSESVTFNKGGSFSTMTVTGVVKASTFTATGNYTLAVGVTRYYSIHPRDWVAQSETIDYTNSGGNVKTGTAGASIQGGGGFHLPNGAVVTSVEVFWFRNDASASGDFLLWRNLMSNEVSSGMAEADSDSTGGAHTVTDSTITNGTIDNSIYSYEFEVYITSNDSTNDCRFKGAIITYYIMSPYP